MSVLLSRAALVAALALHIDVSPILRGRIVSSNEFVPPSLIDQLRSDALSLCDDGEFASSGLSNTAAQQQGFGKKDRLVRAITPDLEGDRDARKEFDRHLDALREHLGASLNRSLICAEQYYSIHGPGAFLTRHMDERHEELKGARGWTTRNRRSVSWLLYLSDDGWDDEDVEGAGSGGAFRGYCRPLEPSASNVGSHMQNLQVGWLASDNKDEETEVPIVEPVFLDCWVQVPNLPPDEMEKALADRKAAEEATAAAAEGEEEYEPPPILWQPLAALYRVTPETGEREWLSPLFDSQAMPAPKDGGVSPTDLAAALAQLLPKEMQDRFSSVEAVPHEGGPPAHIVDVSPVGGTLVLFDSVSVPHEVMPTLKGQRMAMAGWFHEPSQEFPEWFGT